MSQNELQVVCRYGGNFVEGPDHKVSYKDGTNRLIYVHPEIEYPALLSKLLQVCKFTDIESIKYQYPTLGLDSLVSVENDEDILYMKEAYSSQRNCPIQLFVSGSPKTLLMHNANPRYCRMPPKPRTDKGKQIMKEKGSHPRRERPQRGVVISVPGNDDIRRPELETSRGPESESIRRFGAERRHRDSQAGTSRNEGSPTFLSAPSDPFQFATAQVIVSPLLDAILGNLGSAATQELHLVWGADVEKELQKLKCTLSAIQAALEDAEERQLESKAVQDWLHKLKDVAYDTDDLVDEIVTEAQQSKEAENGTEAGKKRKRHSISSSLSCSWQDMAISSSLSCSWQDMACRINKMNVRLAEFETERRDLHLQTRYGSRQLEIIREGQRLVSSVRDESSQVFGREGDREQIIKSLLSNDSGTRKISVVAIVGTGGVGKTTLAKAVFNDKRVRENFELRAWVCASGHFDIKRQTEEFLASASSCDVLGIDCLEHRLQYELNGKKFLLVLDNVGNEMDSEGWEPFKTPLASGANGSKIVVTTQSQAVSDVMQATYTLNLNILSKKDCWSLFVSKAFHGDNLNACPDLLKFGLDLADKCNGLPLAAKALGGLLSPKRDVMEWENILRSPVWDLPGTASKILPALRLSYQQLPGHLKQCFTFCSIFPKDYKFKKDILVQMWVALGFICPEEGKKFEDTGSEYFNDLLLRSFFQPLAEENEEEQFEDTLFDNFTDSVNMVFRKNTLYTIHDLFHDLAQFFSGNECFQMKRSKSHGVLRKIRYLSYNREAINFESFYELKGLRTFFPSMIIHEEVADEMFERLRFIRVLDLSCADITELPNSIGNLRHLRYLNLSHNAIKKLPESICSIYNMQTLLLTGCDHLVELPNEMRKLTNLRHLDLEGCGNIVSMPPQIGELNCLQTLPLFIVGREKERGVAELRELTDIRGKLVIERLENVTDAEHARQANLRNKPLIDELTLVWSEDWNDNLWNEGLEDEVADALEPHPNLKALGLWGYSGARFPRWMMEMDLLLPNLQTLYLRDCRRCSILPPLGRLTSLSSLVIDRMGEVKQIDGGLCAVAGAFPSSESSILHDMRNLQHWPEIEEESDFPFLEKLCNVDCPQLRQLPYSPLDNLTCLYIRRCEKLVSLPWLPSLKQLRLDDLGSLEEWSGVWDAHFPHLQKLSISNCPKMRRWPTTLPLLKELEVFDCCGFDELPLLPHLCKLDLGGDGSDKLLTWVPYFTSLSSLKITFIPNRTSMPRGMLPALTQLKYLKICDCDKLVTLIEENGPQDEGLPTSLTHLKFNGCDSLESLPGGCMLSPPSKL